MPHSANVNSIRSNLFCWQYMTAPCYITKYDELKWNISIQVSFTDGSCYCLTSLLFVLQQDRRNICQ